MKSRRVIILITAAVVSVGVYAIYARPISDSGPVEVEISAPISQAETSSYFDPFGFELERLDSSELEEGFGCVDENGVITCGQYEGRSALVLAALTRRHDVLKRLSTWTILNNDGHDALFTAAGIGDMESIRILVAKGSELGFFSPDSLGSYPLFGIEDPEHAKKVGIAAHPAYSAAEYGHLEVLQYFMDRGFQLETKFPNGADIMAPALMGKNVNVLKFLLANGYSIDCGYKYPNGRSHEAAAKAMQFDAAYELIKSYCTM